MMQNAIHNRNIYWDSLKGFLIICVLLGHFLQLLPHTEMVLGWIYLFHMPLFIFVSGYFSNPKSENYLKGMLKLGVIYAICQIVYRLLFSCMTMHNLIVPGFALWYLLALFVWRILIYILPVEKYRWWSLLLSVVIALLMGFIPVSREFAFQRIFSFFPFFVLSYLMRGKDVRDMLKSGSNIYILVLVSAALVQFYRSTFVPMSLSIADCYQQPYWKPLVIRLISILVGTIMSGAIIAVLKENKAFAVVGNKSLLIYIVHIPIYEVVRILIQ